ncbi:TonB-dependent receptor [Phenylobacterium sp. J367]|uniref:TonB-dependent receptor domain-containing protein n=1 Tax=Phenylobacterium sp. J367 TaxID=2898435 RepID=UPI002150E787|nr:TonB-dependent receptor [Phenylobacterium sp. J367]MCR5877892.1 TonB-dependent receptor [Phenylobacterium sp. J367]
MTSPLQAALTPNSATLGLPLGTAAMQCQMCFDTDDGNYINLENNGYNFQATLHLDNIDVKYLGGYTYYDYRLQTDLDGTSRQAAFNLPLSATSTPLYYPRRNNQYQEEVWWFSNELNFASTYDGPVQWLIGLYQFREGSNYTLSDARHPDDPRFENPTLFSLNPATQLIAAAPNPERRYAYGSSSNVSESYAAFGQVDWQFTDELKATAGLRYTHDEKKSFESARLFCLYTATCPISRVTGRPVDVTAVASPGTSTDPSIYLPAYTDPTTGLRHRGLKNSWSGVTGTLGLDWQPDPDTLAYAKYTRGYKAGGFNSGTTTLTPNVTTKEETIDAYEVGVKKTFGGRLQANASAFFYDYQDIQIPITGRDPVTDLNVTRFFNMPKAEVLGFELETIWQPIDNLQLLANYSYLSAELKEACCFQDPEDPRGIQDGVVLAGNTPAAIANPATALNQDLKGAKLPSSTPHRFTVNANYTWVFDAGSLVGSVTHVWKDETYYSIFNRYYNQAKAWNQTDARLLWNDADDRFTVIGYVKNIFEQEGVSGADGSRINTGPNTGYVNRTISYVPPRTYGVEVQYRF